MKDSLRKVYEEIGKELVLASEKKSAATIVFEVNVDRTGGAGRCKAITTKHLICK